MIGVELTSLVSVKGYGMTQHLDVRLVAELTFTAPYALVESAALLSAQPTFDYLSRR